MVNAGQCPGEERGREESSVPLHTLPEPPVGAHMRRSSVDVPHSLPSIKQQLQAEGLGPHTSTEEWPQPHGSGSWKGGRRLQNLA